ncbi:hypothetical protein TNCV_4197461 [Trichonephila clavipes]|nr:hypothetical protein TNCV_4197461 [Trichonephila clavipes]
MEGLQWYQDANQRLEKSNTGLKFATNDHAVIPPTFNMWWMWGGEFEPSAAEDSPCRGTMHIKSVDAQTSSHWYGVEVRKGGASTGIALLT